jgi:hypothetical protein
VCHSSKRLRFFLLIIVVMMVGFSACSPTANNTTPALTATSSMVPAYTLPGGGECVKLGQHAQAPFTNVRVSHDAYLAHSEPILAENPKNPLNLVGGSKFFTNPAHYQFQIGYFSSLDGGCTWTDSGVLPGFEKNETTSDISFAFGNRNDVYAAVLYEKGGAQGKSGIAVLTSTDGGKSFGNPVSVFEARADQIFSDKPWIAVDQTDGPQGGSIYVVWSYDHNGTCGDFNNCSEELAFSRSTDGGKTFSYQSAF